MTVYILFENRDGREYVLGVYATRKAANTEKKKLREREPDRRVTFPILAYEVEGEEQ